jgi:putative glycosyltransferase (TIGR04372 family)
MSLSQKLFSIIGPVRVYSGASSINDTFNEFLVDLMNLLSFNPIRILSVLRFLFQILFGIFFSPISTMLYFMGYRIIFGTIFNQIGEICLLDASIKREKLLNSKKKIVMVLGECEKGNRHLLKKYSEHIKIFNWPSFNSLFWCLCTLNPLLRIDIVKLDAHDNKATLSKIYRIWFKKNLKPLLNPEKFNINWKNLPINLINNLKSGNFVCIHSRDIGFYKYIHTTRNYNIQTISTLVQSLINAGVVVIRIGKNPEFIIDKKILSNKDYYFDSCNIASPDQDVFFLSNCLFYVGCSSGPAQVPAIFGVKSLLINTYPAVNGKGLSFGDFTIFKKIKSITKDKYLNIEEYFSKPFELPLQHHKLASLGYKLENNTSDEIMNAFNDFLHFNRHHYPSLYKSLYNENNYVLSSVRQSKNLNIDRFMKPRHWTFRSLGSYSKSFIKSYMDKQQINLSIKNIN